MPSTKPYFSSLLGGRKVRLPGAQRWNVGSRDFATRENWHSNSKWVLPIARNKLGMTNINYDKVALESNDHLHCQKLYSLMTGR